MGTADPPPYIGDVRPLPNPPSAGTVVLIGFGEGVGVEFGNRPRISSIAFRGLGGGEAEVTGAGGWVADSGSMAGELPKISSSRFCVFDAATCGIPVESEEGPGMSSPPSKSPPWVDPTGLSSLLPT